MAKQGEGTIRKELMKAAGIKPEDGESDTEFLIRLQGVISDDITNEQWADISAPAQDWNNAAADALKDGRAFPALPDETPDPEAGEQAKPSVRRGRMTDGVQGATGMETFVPKVGSPVIVTTKRGKTVAGIVVDILANNGGYTLNPNGTTGAEEDDTDFTTAQIESIVAQAPPLDKMASDARTGEGTKQEEEEEDENPAMGDEVSITNLRGKLYKGKVTFLDETVMALHDDKGVEHEISIDRIDQAKTVIHKRAKADTKAEKAAVAAQANPPAPAPMATARRRGAAAAEAPAPAPAPAEPTGRRRSAAATEPAATEGADDGRQRAPAGIGTRARDMTVDHPSWSLEKVEEALKKEGFTWRGATVSMVYKDTHYVMDRSKK